MTETEHFSHHGDETELEKFLGRTLSKIEPYSNQILLGFLIATVVAVGIVMVVRGQRATSSAGWTAYAACRAPDDYAQVAKDFSGTPVGNWASLQAARGFLEEGLQFALTNRTASDDRLNQAKEEFEKLLATSGVAPEIREESLNGLAASLETLSGDSTDEAIAAYEALISEFPESQHRRWAEHRIEELKAGSTKQFYAWFRQQNPQPTDRPLPQDTAPSSSSTPPMDSSLPELPLTIPGGSTSTTPKEGDEGEKPRAMPAPDAKPETSAETSEERPPSPPEAEKTKPADDATETPAEPKESSEATKPAAESESSEKPAEPKTSEPAPEKPADESPESESSPEETASEEAN